MKTCFLMIILFFLVNCQSVSRATEGIAYAGVWKGDLSEEVARFLGNKTIEVIVDHENKVHTLYHGRPIQGVVMADGRMWLVNIEDEFDRGVVIDDTLIIRGEVYYRHTGSARSKSSVYIGLWESQHEYRNFTKLLSIEDNMSAQYIRKNDAGDEESSIIYTYIDSDESLQLFEEHSGVLFFKGDKLVFDTQFGAIQLNKLKEDGYESPEK